MYTRRPAKMEREKCLLSYSNFEDFDEDLASPGLSREKVSCAAERVRRLQKVPEIKIGIRLDYEKIETNRGIYVKSEECEKNPQSSERLDLFSSDVEQRVADTKTVSGGLEYSNLNKMMALFSLEAGDELGAIEYLIKSHAVFLQSSINHRYKKTLVRNEYYEAQEVGLKPEHMKLNSRSSNIGDSLSNKLSNLPEEWYVVQLTAQFKPSGVASPEDAITSFMCPLHITILPTGPKAADPICITVPQFNTENYDAVKEIVKIVKNNKDSLETQYSDNAHYWNARAKQNSNMKVAMTVLENEWLREWKILLMADPLENSRIVEDMRAMIDKLIADDMSIIKVSPRSRWLLKKIATGACYLTKLEIARAVHYVIGDNKKLASNIILSIHGKLASVEDLRTATRKTLILIVDESLDHIPFESMNLLTNHPVTRFPSFHVAYAMFKEHEDTMEKGCKIVRISDALGSYIVNPGGDLMRTETRMKLFIGYWLSKWKGICQSAPDETSFRQALTNYDILMYVGHGSGIQYLPGNKIEKLKVRALPLLFGCSSLKLLPLGGRFPPMGVSNRYMTACSPCVLGTLWEVTDGDVDKLTARFMSDWIPSSVPKPWSDVDINKWASGKLKFTTPATDAECPKAKNEPEMLRAIAKSKEACTQHMTAAAVVVRGLPIRLV